EEILCRALNRETDKRNSLDLTICIF
ncbi:hypothetical protein VCHENC02_5471B, partial [Vibrio harveyi]